MKTKHKQIILGIIILIGLFSVISYASACMAMNYHITIIGSDNADKIIKAENNKFNVSKDAYKHFKDKNTTIKIHKEYQVKNKKGKLIFNSEDYYEIKNFKKNKINLKNNNSSNSSIKQVKKYKTNSNDNNLNSKYIKKQFIDKFKTNDSLDYPDLLGDNMSFMKYSINWKENAYVKFLNMKYINYEYGDNYSILMEIMKIVNENNEYLKYNDSTNHSINSFLLKTVKIINQNKFS